MLERLTGAVAAESTSLNALLRAAAQLDVAAARAGHARWVRGARPAFVVVKGGEGMLHVPGAFHPLLLEPALPPLPEPPSVREAGGAA